MNNRSDESQLITDRNGRKPVTENHEVHKMTKKELTAEKEWNIRQGKIYDETWENYLVLRKKYYDLEGSSSCSFIDFLMQVATCTKVSRNEREKDLNTIIEFYRAEGRREALFDFLGTMVNNGVKL